MSDYPDRWSEVEVIFNDGTVQTYTIKVGASFGRHMAQQAGACGVLSMLCGPKTHHIPLTSIREWNLTELPGEPE